MIQVKHDHAQGASFFPAISEVIHSGTSIAQPGEIIGQGLATHSFRGHLSSLGFAMCGFQGHSSRFAF